MAKQIWLPDEKDRAAILDMARKVRALPGDKPLSRHPQKTTGDLPYPVRLIQIASGRPGFYWALRYFLDNSGNMGQVLSESTIGTRDNSNNILVINPSDINTNYWSINPHCPHSSIRTVIEIGHYESYGTVAVIVGFILEPFTARITGNTQDGTNKRWAYSFIEVEKTVAGYSGWTDLANGRTGTVRNRLEDQNGASGTYGNGVSSLNLTGTFDIIPIPTGTRIRVDPVSVATNSDVFSVEYWTTYANGVDGACE